MIVAVVARRTPEAVRDALEALAATPEARRGDVLAEIRLDALAAPAADVCAGAPLPVMATCRRPRDGGAYRGSEADRVALLRAAAAAGAAWVDVEVDAAVALGRPPAPTKLVVSHHDFDALPPDPRGLVERLLKTGADVVKFAARVRGCVDVMALSRAAKLSPGRVVAFGLGAAGIPTRLLFERFGSPWVYARFEGPGSVDAGAIPLPRELPTFEAVRASRPHGTGTPPEVAYGVVGDRAEESVGPAAFDAVFRARGIAAQYVPLPTSTTTAVREACRLFGIRALSVTTPFKVEALRLADDVHPRAAEIGAANTLVNEGGEWTAYNTDVDGIGVPVKAAFAAAGRNPGGLRAVVVGLGGAGLAAAWALRAAGFRTSLVARRADTVGTAPLGRGVDVVGVGDVRPGSVDLAVNATPAGSARDPDGRAVDLAWLRPEGFVFETNYRPRTTPLLAAARAAGLRTLDGAAMYVAQAVAQLRLFRTDCDDAEAQLAAAVDAALPP
jgi:3-dehydroquinate dehydratase/shikimate dehydrogenase